jgi:hypothetical protein
MRDYIMTFVPITDAEIDVDSPVTQVLMTKYRDNINAIGLRGSATPKLLGVPYDRQVFTASGTWTKPSNAATGDLVMVWGIGGGGSGASDSTGTNAKGGIGGSGFIYRIEDIDTLAATLAVTIGAGAAANASGVGDAGGNTSIGVSGSPGYAVFSGGFGGTIFAGAITNLNSNIVIYSPYLSANTTVSFTTAGLSSEWGGGSGGNGGDGNGGYSQNAGHGGKGNQSGNGESGAFPGGGGGGVDSDGGGSGGAGGAGYMVVYSIKEG